MLMQTAPVGILCAIPEEIDGFTPYFQETAAQAIAGLNFRTGRMAGRDIVLAECGIGKVNAAIVGTLLLHHFKVGSLLFSGVAGGIDPALDVGDVVIAQRLIQHDYGALTAGRLQPYQPGVPPLPGIDDRHGYEMDGSLAARLASVLESIDLSPVPGSVRAPRLRFGTVLTGDHFLNCADTRTDLFARFQAQAVEMEGAALAQVAQRFATPLVVVRALSDLAGSDSHLDFPSFARAAAINALHITRRILPIL